MENLLNGKGIDMPKSAPSQTFKQAEKVKKGEGQEEGREAGGVGDMMRFDNIAF